MAKRDLKHPENGHGNKTNTTSKSPPRDENPSKFVLLLVLSWLPFYSSPIESKGRAIKQSIKLEYLCVNTSIHLSSVSIQVLWMGFFKVRVLSSSFRM